MKNILFIGTSFLGALHLAYGLRNTQSFKSTFLGFSAPVLANFLDNGWKIESNNFIADDRFKCFVSDGSTIHKRKVESNLSSLKSVNGVSISLENFTDIVYVDLFHGFRAPIAFDENELISFDGIPISIECLQHMQYTVFNGWIQLQNHPRWGHVPFINSFNFIQSFRNAIPLANAFAISQPRPINQSVLSEVNLNRLRISFDFVENFYSNKFSDMGIKYIAQPDAVLDENKAFTQPKFSRGPHPNRPGMLDIHMNSEYGEIMLMKLEDQIHKVF